MWGRPVIMPSDTEEVRQESAFLGNESDGNDDEEATAPQNQNQTSVEDMEEEHTPRTPSEERMGTPPPPEPEGEVESGISPRSRPSADQNEEVKRGTLEGAGAMRSKSPQYTGVLDSRDPESASVMRPEAPPPAEVQDRPEAGPRVARTMRPEAPQPTEVQDRTGANPKANTSGLRRTDSEAAPNVEAIPTTEEPDTSRFRAALEVLGMGLLGHPMKAIKNLIPEGFLAHAGTASP
ncbi:uncharacterized protein LOC133859593 [Alnus glutinosa]|uniref:uncharacterized protein LOC133859593 n=1 Tax=Alnus glutinosa TaxID=3517 RepID=UPI002D79A13F|nr:uncharacterized protein LOC133859593 [Alnus glutinosa]